MIAIPLALTILRLLLGPVAIVFATTNQPHWYYAPLLTIGMLSDIFDGVLARRFGVARPWLRRFDSATDIVFYFCIFVTTCLVAGSVVRRAILPLGLLALSEAACVVIGLWRFHSLPAAHCYSAKIYGLAIFFAFLGVLAFDFGAWVFFGLAIVALVANAEIIAILLLSETAPVDVLTVFRLKRKII